MKESFPIQEPSKLPEETNPEMNHRGYDESPAEIYERYLEELGLTEADLLNKQILDMGAGNAGFAAAIKERNIPAQIVSVDENKPREGAPLAEKEGYVVAEAQSLPFPDNTFDLVVSVHALPHVAHTRKLQYGEVLSSHVDDNGTLVQEIDHIDWYKVNRDTTELVAQAVRECIRVAKEGSEIRFGGVRMGKPEDAQSDEQPSIIGADEFIQEGFLEGIKGLAEIIKYPGSNEESLIIIRKRSEKNQPQGS